MPLSLLLLAQVAAAAPAQGIIVYPPEFFADQRPNNAREMLERVPGFVLDDGSAVRGFEGAAGNVLIEGRRPATKTDTLYDILTRLPSGRVARIELIRGGAGGVDMQGKSVLANVVLKRGGGVRGQLSAAANQPLSDPRTGGMLAVEASGETAGRTWEVSTELQKVVVGLPGDGPAATFGGGQPPRRTALRTEWDGVYLLSSGGFETPAAGGRLKLNGRLFRDKQKIEEDEAEVAGPGLASSDEMLRTHDWELGGSFKRAITTRDDLELVALRQSSHLDYASTLAADQRQAFANARRTRETIARAALKRRWTATAWSELGAEAAANRLMSRTAFAVDGIATPLPAADVEVREDRENAFLKGGWRMASAWSLDGAVHYERSRITSEGDVILSKRLRYWKPRAVLAWSAGAATQVRVRIEREVGQLDFDDFVAQASLNTDAGVTAGNPDLVPERAWTAEAVLEQRFWDRGALTLTVQRSDVQGVVDRGPVFSPAGVFDRPANIGDGRKDLVRVDLTLPLARLGVPGGQLKGFAVRRWSRVDDPTTGEARRISGLRPTEWQAHFTQDLPARNMTWGVSAFGGWQKVYYRFNAVDALKREPYVMIFAEWRPRRDLDLRVELQNLTGRGERRTTVTWPGPRNAGGAAIARDRDPHFGRLIHVRLRKSFGS